MIVTSHGRHVRHWHVREWWRGRHGTVALLAILAVLYGLGMTLVMVVMP